jgi:S1-C subfamily serine protease
MTALALRTLACVAVAVMALAAVAPGVPAEDLDAVRSEVEQTLPKRTLDDIVVPMRLSVRSAHTKRGPAIYERHVDGVVLIASTKTVATGVLVSEHGDIVTNDHIVEHAQRVGGEAWLAVWFRPPPGMSSSLGSGSFLLARVVQRESRRDLARLRLAQPAPETATVIEPATPGTAMPGVGGKVFTIGHPGSAAWRLAEGTVSVVRPDYQWRYGDGVPRSATTLELVAPITTGNSGGPVFDERGAMVGIVVGSAVPQQGVGYAVAVQHVHELLKAIARR